MSGRAARSITLVQGVFAVSFFDLLKKRKAGDVFVTEGRPSLEAARVSCRELLKRKITPTLIADNMAGFLFYRGWVREVWLSTQVVDRHGAICDIGALILSVLSRKHKVPVYLFPAGRKTRFIGNPKTLVYFQGVRIAPAGVKGYAPLVEWVPDKYITKVYDG
jgi:methylthioribose-1-phosphate isomerase